MTALIRRVPALVLLLVAAACGGDDAPESTTEDAGGNVDSPSTDETTSIDTAPPNEDGGDGVDAPPNEDAGRRDAGGGTGVDAGNRGDSGMRADTAGGDSTVRMDAQSTIDAPGRVDSGSGTSDARVVIDASSDRSIPSCLGTIDTDFLREKLSQLSGALPVNINGADVTIPERNSAANRAKAREFLTAEYQALGFTVTEHMYSTGVNLVATRAGADDKFLVLSAHYDSIKDTVPGADDDGSGTIGGLATARALQNCQFDHSLRIVAFDEEEDGLVGSKAYVSSLQSSGDIANLIGDVQLEMLGYHTKQDGGFLLVDCRSSEGDRPESKFLNDAVLAAIMRGGLALEPHDACTGSSDHSPFWTASKPAIVFSQEFFFSGADSTPCYHKDCDAIDKINFDYYTKLATLGATVTADLIGAH